MWGFKSLLGHQVLSGIVRDRLKNAKKPNEIGIFICYGLAVLTSLRAKWGCFWGWFLENRGTNYAAFRDENPQRQA